MQAKRIKLDLPCSHTSNSLTHHTTLCLVVVFNLGEQYDNMVQNTSYILWPYNKGTTCMGGVWNAHTIHGIGIRNELVSKLKMQCTIFVYYTKCTASTVRLTMVFFRVTIDSRLPYLSCLSYKIVTYSRSLSCYICATLTSPWSSLNDYKKIQDQYLIAISIKVSVWAITMITILYLKLCNGFVISI